MCKTDVMSQWEEAKKIQKKSINWMTEERHLNNKIKYIIAII